MIHLSRALKLAVLRTVSISSASVTLRYTPTKKLNFELSVPDSPFFSVQNSEIILEIVLVNFCDLC